MTEVNGTPVWTAHPETGVAEAIAALLVEFYKEVDQRKRQRPRRPVTYRLLRRTVLPPLSRLRRPLNGNSAHSCGGSMVNNHAPLLDLARPRRSIGSAAD